MGFYGATDSPGQDLDSWLSQASEGEVRESLDSPPDSDLSTRSGAFTLVIWRGDFKIEIDLHGVTREEMVEVGKLVSKGLASAAK